MRTPSLIAGTVLACGLAFAGQSESVVYTDGNLSGIATHTKAVLDLSQDKAMKLRAGRTDVSVPYSSITKSDAAVDTAAVAAPGKKNAKPPQAVTVEFKSVQGDTRSMTLQMNKDAAARVLAKINKQAPPATTTLAEVKTASAPTEQAAGEEAAAVKGAPVQDSTPAAQPSQNAKNQSKTDKQQARKQAKADKKAKEKADKLAKNEKKPDPNATVTDLIAKQPPKDNAWWGDSVWKTDGNRQKWEPQANAATAAAQ